MLLLVWEVDRAKGSFKHLLLLYLLCAALLLLCSLLLLLPCGPKAV
jgi:hypothetical protein